LIDQATEHTLNPLDAQEQKALRDLLTRVCFP